MKISTRSLTSVLVLCWTVPLILKKLSPELFGSALIQYPAFLIVCILAPLCFIRALKENEYLIGMLTAIIPITNIIGMTGFVYMSLYSIDDLYDDAVVVKDFIVSAQEAPDEEGRKLSAVFLYHEIGGKISYRKDDGEQAFISPTEKDKETLSNNRKLSKAKIELRVWMLAKSKETFWLAMIQLMSFSLAGLIYIFLQYMDKVRSKSNNSNSIS